MAKLTTKRDKARGWTASTFLPENSSSQPMDITSILDVISEDSVDEDLSDTHGGESVGPGTSNGTGKGSDSSGDTSSSSSSSAGESDDDQGGDADHDVQEDEDEHSSGQDRGTSDDSEEESSPSTDNHDMDIDNEQSGEGTKRSLSGARLSRTSGSNGGTSASTLSTSPSTTKVVSATPTRKITKKLKKSVKAKGSKGALSSAAARQATEDAKFEAAKPIVSRFLELENTKLNDKLLQVFMTPGVLGVVIEYITRLDPEIAKEINSEEDVDANQETLFMKRVQQCTRKRDYSDLNLMKKSYTAMNFIVRTDVYNEFILSSGHQTIVKELFKIFRPESNGNFYHFQKVFETVLKKFRSHTMATLFEDTDPDTGAAKTPLIFEMLPFLDQSPVALSFVKVLFPTYTYGFGDKMPDYYRTLQRGHLMEMLLAMVTLKNEESSSSMGDFVVSLLDEATRAKEAKVIFSCFADDPIWAERLVQGIVSSDSPKRHGCIEIIYSLLVRSIQVPFQDMFANSIYITEKSYDRVESHLEPTANAFAKHLAPHIPALCKAFVGSNLAGEQISLSGYTVCPSFTVARLWLLDSIYHCLNDVEEDPTALQSIPDIFWSTLVDSFIQFRFNNAYHVLFYKMFRVVLYSQLVVAYDRFFVKTHLISRFIEHFKAAGQPTGSRGYIILALNCIRLSADVESQRLKSGSDRLPKNDDVSLIPPTYWADVLRQNSDWIAFKTTLREVTLEQTRDTLCDMDPNLRFQFAPLQSRQPSEAPLTKRHFGIPSVSVRGSDGIDLGSQYGNSLGFGVPMEYDPALEERIKAEAERKQELEVEKALANMMPTMDWRLIPPQRVIDAMREMNQPPSTGETNSEAEESDGTSTDDSSSTSASTKSDSTTSQSRKRRKKKKKKSKGNAV